MDHLLHESFWGVRVSDDGGRTTKAKALPTHDAWGAQQSAARLDRLQQVMQQLHVTARDESLRAEGLSIALKVVPDSLHIPSRVQWYVNETEFESLRDAWERFIYEQSEQHKQNRRGWNILLRTRITNFLFGEPSGLEIAGSEQFQEKTLPLLGRLL